MKRVGRWVVTTTATAAIVVAVAGIGGVLAQGPDSTATPTPAQVAPEATSPAQGFGHDGWRDGLGDHDENLAEALGISVEALDAAKQQAFAEALQQAVDQGLLTQEEADALQSGERGPRGFHRHGLREGSIDRDALLADALGITPEALDAARDEARAASLADAVAVGQITQEQADLMAARAALRDYVDRDPLLAQALGMSAEELQAARADGQSMDELLAARGLDRATVRAAMQSAYQQAVQQAVTDGIITQAQADQLQNGEGFGGMRGGPGGHHGWGHGGPHGDTDDVPAVTPESDS